LNSPRSIGPAESLSLMYGNQNHPDPDTLAAYALDALSADEVVELGAHLTSCAHCQGEVSSLRAVANLLPQALPLAEPPADLRARILQRARGEQAVANMSGPVAAPARRGVRAWFPRLAPLLALLLLVLAFVAGQRWAAAPGNDLAGAPGTQIARLSGQGSGTLAVNPEQGRVRLAVSDLPPLPEDQVYQLWLLGTDAPISAGTFTVDASGRGQVEFSGLAWSPMYSGVAITREPPGGSPGPTSDILIQGNL
jgi:anti-sigma-K factor RskA